MENMGTYSSLKFVFKSKFDSDSVISKEEVA